jgi:4-carboxymuconolactone decarboxylase
MTDDRKALVEAIKSDYHRALLTESDRAMLDFVAKLTLRPAAMAKSDEGTLHHHGFDDSAVHDIVQVTGLFAPYNRLADGLGIDPEDDSSPP